MIVNKGYILRKNDIFRLKERFDNLSENKPFLYLNDYLKA